ncbi:MAG: hypothetical protein WBQ86_09735 [Candidatus Binatus sp.]
MNFYDLNSQIAVAPAIAPVSVANNTPLVSAIIDRKDYEGVEFIIETGAIASGTAEFTASLVDGNQANLSDAAPVTAAPSLVGALPAIPFSAPNSAFKFGYAGPNRYVQLTITPSANAAAALLTAVAVLYRGKFSGKQPGPGSFPASEGTPLSN